MGLQSAGQPSRCQTSALRNLMRQLLKQICASAYIYCSVSLQNPDEYTFLIPHHKQTISKWIIDPNVRNKALKFLLKIGVNLCDLE
jgi:hypothetical protein